MDILPDDVLYIIIEILPLASINSLANVCKRFNYLTRQPSIYKHKIEQIVPEYFDDKKWNALIGDYENRRNEHYQSHPTEQYFDYYWDNFYSGYDYIRNENIIQFQKDSWQYLYIKYKKCIQVKYKETILQIKRTIWRNYEHGMGYDIELCDKIKNIGEEGFDFESYCQTNDFFSICCANDNVNLATYLLEMGVVPNISTADNPLVSSVVFRSIKIFKFLLKHGVDPNIISVQHKSYGLNNLSDIIAYNITKSDDADDIIILRNMMEILNT